MCTNFTNTIPTASVKQNAKVRAYTHWSFYKTFYMCILLEALSLRQNFGICWIAGRRDKWVWFIVCVYFIMCRLPLLRATCTCMRQIVMEKGLNRLCFQEWFPDTYAQNIVRTISTQISCREISPPRNALASCVTPDSFTGCRSQLPVLSNTLLAIICVTITPTERHISTMQAFPQKQIIKFVGRTNYYSSQIIERLNLYVI